MTHAAIALIPARSGSERVKDKNVKLFAGHPLIAYTIRAAADSGVFRAIVVSTDSPSYAEIARSYGAEVPFLRPAEQAGAHSRDDEWVRWTLERLRHEGRAYDAFSILRPTSPFRLPETIRRAWSEFASDPSADSLRAVEKCGEHPAKMWRVDRGRMAPVLQNPDPAGAPWHSSPYQTLPEIYVQNASLEIARTRVVLETNSISGREIRPFFTQGYEGFDINRPEDWVIAEHIVRERLAELPVILSGAKRREGSQDSSAPQNDVKR